MTEGVNFSTISASYDGTNPGSNTNHAAGDASFVFSTVDETLYYDPDGTGPGYTVVAETPGTVAVAADVEIVTG